MNVFFFTNGNTVVCDKNGEQIPKFQRSYLLMFAEFLEDSGIDPTTVEFNMPGGDVARLFKTRHGYNWRMS